MSVILMTTLFYKAILLQGEIWCWSLLGIKGLSPPSSIVLRNPVNDANHCHILRPTNLKNAVFYSSLPPKILKIRKQIILDSRTQENSQRYLSIDFYRVRWNKVLVQSDKCLLLDKGLTIYKRVRYSRLEAIGSTL